MSASFSRLCLCLTIILFCADMVMASDTTMVRFPSAVLVMLNSETNRIEAMENAHLYKKKEIAMSDGEKERKAMINDFTDHFTFCPVYYFMDTNMEAAQKRDFSRILMNADGTPVTDVPDVVKRGEYYIVYYGFPLRQDQSTEEVAQSDSTATTLTFGRGLIICNRKMSQVSFLYKFAYNDMFIKQFSDRKYYYFSKTFDIEYYPFAKVFNKKLRKGPYHMRITKAI